MVISTDAEKNIWQNPTTFHDETLKKLEIENFKLRNLKNPELALYT